MSDNSIRTNYPMMFNQTVIPFPTDYSENSQTVESVMQTEAGKDVVTISRYDKLKATMSFVCLQNVVQTLGSFKTVDRFIFKRYNPTIDDYEERTVRMRNFNCKPRKGSEDLKEVKGVWEVSFDLEEF